MVGALAIAGAVPTLAPAEHGEGTSLVAVANAHDAVLSSSPANGEVVSEFPTEIVFEFSGLVQDDFNTIAITEKSSGEVIFEGEPTIDGQMVSIEVPAGTATNPGEYTIGFQITSSDGHPTRGGVDFTFTPENAVTDTPEATATDASASNNGSDSNSANETEASETANEAEEENSSSSMLLIVLIIGAVVVSSVVATTRRKKNNDES